MSEDWQVGDLALCVRGGFISGLGGLEYPVGGRVYIVGAVVHDWKFQTRKTPGLQLVDGPPNRRGSRIWAAFRFRKIHPHTPDAEDVETIRLLTDQPQRVGQ